MSLIRPFRGLRPAAGQAGAVAAPPYDVLSSDEARSIVHGGAAGKPWSFLHISKPEIDLPREIDIYSPEVYAKAAENLQKMLAAGVLRATTTPCYYAYRLTMGAHVQTGLVAAASVADYDSNRIRKHEFTRPDKEDDRVRQIEALNAQTGPVLLAYPASRTADDLIAAIAQGTPAADVTADDGIRHQIWVLRDAARIAAITAASTPCRRSTSPTATIAPPPPRASPPRATSRARTVRRRFPVGDLPPPPDEDPRLQPRGQGSARPGKVGAGGTARPRFRGRRQPGQVHPARPGEFGMYLAGRWRKLTHQARTASRPIRWPASMSRCSRTPAGADAGHRRPAPRQAHRFRRRHPRPGRNWKSASIPARWRWPSRCIRRAWTS
jgi:hypothetical protein